MAVVIEKKAEDEWRKTVEVCCHLDVCFRLYDVINAVANAECWHGNGQVCHSVSCVVLTKPPRARPSAGRAQFIRSVAPMGIFAAARLNGIVTAMACGFLAAESAKRTVLLPYTEAGTRPILSCPGVHPVECVVRREISSGADGGAAAGDDACPVELSH